MNKNFIKATLLFVLGLITIFYLIWVILGAIPNARLNPLGAALGVDLPNDFGQYFNLKTFLVLGALSVLSIAIIILNVYFGAVITTHFIRPRVRLITSSGGVLSTKWNATKPHVLVRMSNFHKADLLDVKVSVVMTLEEIRSNGIKDEPFICYLPVKDFTPQNILVMTQRMPWSLAVPADALLSNSLTKDYHFKPGEPILKSFTPGKTLSYAKRTLEFLIQGVDAHSYANFVIHRRVVVDEQKGDQYTLHIHKGTFKSLPLQIVSEKDLEEVAA